MRHVHLDPVGALVELLARGPARLNWPIDEFHSLGKRQFGGVVLQRIATGARYGQSAYEHTWPGNVTGLNCLLDAHIAVPGPFRSHVAYGRKSLLKGATRR